MPNQKLENLLNLALLVTEEEREKSLNLDTGYNRENRTWELIIKYHGDLTRLEGSSIIVEDLIAGYAIVTIPENLIKPFSELDEVEYIEKPKRLFYDIGNAYVIKNAPRGCAHFCQGNMPRNAAQKWRGISQSDIHSCDIENAMSVINETKIEEVKRSSCILPVTVRPPNLTGKGVIVTVIDSGIDYRNQAFRNADGTTRILRLWDQTLRQDEEKGYLPPEGFQVGVEFNREQINALLEENSGQELTADITGHGTAVAAIAASSKIGGDDGVQTVYEGIASASDLVIVKLGNPRPDSFPRTTELMRALTYAVRIALLYDMPTVINLSFGNTYGNHAGDSLLERFVDNITEIGRNCVIVGSGNEGASLGHTAKRFLQDGFVELSVGSYETSLSVQIWLSYEDEYRITLLSPAGDQAVIESTRDLARETASGNVRKRTLEDTTLLLYVGEPSPYAVSQEVYIDMIPNQQYVTSGVWRILFEPLEVVNGYVNLYLPSDAVRSQNTFFFLPTPEMTLTIPSTAQRVITVGAYNSILKSYADFSGRGFPYENQSNQNILSQLDNLNVKPDIVAPGVNIESVAVGGGTIYVTGTSFATPVVTGCVALMMEWGIVKGNDPYLYGAKVKAYLRKGAKTLPGYTQYPNAQVGWGALCLQDSLPGG